MWGRVCCCCVWIITALPFTCSLTSSIQPSRKSVGSSSLLRAFRSAWGPLLHLFTLNGYFPDVWTETKFCRFQMVTSGVATRDLLILPQPVEETLECDVRSLGPWDEIPSPSPSPSPRLHLRWKIPDPVRLGWITEHVRSDLILAFFQYSAALNESCPVMRHEPYYTNPQSCVKFSLILFPL